ncbi:MAG: hypothetical protein ABIJ44_07535 [Pseudomonadota bacterium]
MNDRIATATVENVETGEKFDMGKFYFFPTGYELTAIILVKGIETYGPFPDGDIQVDVACKALDSAGMVFDLDANFIRHTAGEKEALLSDITPNSVHIFCGQYGIDNHGSIALTDPAYRSVQPDFKEDEVREAFRINEEHRINVALLHGERP